MNHLLLAAFLGHSKVLEKIIEFYDEKGIFGKKSEGKAVSFSKQVSRNLSSDENNEFSNWNPLEVVTTDRQENVLHLILQGPFMNGYRVKK